MSLDNENDGAEFHEKTDRGGSGAYPDKSAKRRQKHLSVAKPAGEDEEHGHDAARSPNAT